MKSIELSVNRSGASLSPMNDKHSPTGRTPSFNTKFPFQFPVVLSKQLEILPSAIYNFSHAEIDIKISHSNASRASRSGSANKMASVYI